MTIQEFFRKSMAGLFAGNQKMPPAKYSPEWFHTIPDAELIREREPIRKRAIYGPGYDPWAERTLDQFNVEEIRRMNIRDLIEHPNPKPRHSEHGWYLPEDDD